MYVYRLHITGSLYHINQYFWKRWLHAYLKQQGSTSSLGRFSLALTIARDVLEGYTRIYSKVVSNPPH